jgi:hypothetical protein
MKVNATPPPPASKPLLAQREAGPIRQPGATGHQTEQTQEKPRVQATERHAKVKVGTRLDLQG